MNWQLYIAAGVPTLVFLTGFLRNEQQFTTMGERFDRMDERINRLDGRLDRIEARLDRVDADLRQFFIITGHLTGRLDAMEGGKRG